MSDAFILRAGGGGGLSVNAAILHVQAPIGSTITLSKNNVVVKVLGPEKSHANADDNTLADWYYSVSQNNYGTWTVTATLGTDTASNTITIDSNEQYDVVLSYNLYLVRNGVLLVPVTSGTANAFVEETVNGLMIQHQGDARSARAYWELTSSLLGGITYRTINVNVESWSKVANNDTSTIAVNTRADIGGEITAKRAYGNTFPGVLTLDVSNITLASKYFYIRVAEGGGTAYVNDLYLSR